MQGFWLAHGCALPQDLSHAKSAEDIVLYSVLPALKVENLQVMEIALKLLHVFGGKKGLLTSLVMLQHCKVAYFYLSVMLIWVVPECT